MLNRIRSDLYRLAHGRMLWVCLVGIVAVCVFSAWAVWLPTTPSGAGLDTAALMSRRFESHSDLLGQLDPLPAMICSVVGVLIVAQDRESGFAKSIAAHRGRRMGDVCGNLAIVALASCLIELACVVATEGAFLLFGFSIGSQPIGEVLGYIALSLLSCATYALLSACVAQLLRSKAGGIVFAVLASSGMLGIAALSILGFLAQVAPVAERIAMWLPATGSALARSWPAAETPASVVQLLPLPAPASAAFILTAWCIVAVAATILVARRDVA